MTDMGAAAVARRFSMQGRRALVTGGSLSIGRAISLAFADAGADVAIHHSPAADAVFERPNAAADTVAEVAARGGRGFAIPADFALAGEGSRTVAEAMRLLGGLDVLVVCASIQYRTPFAETTPEQIDRQVKINFNASVELLQAVVPPMKAQGYGRILTIGSINQVRPEPMLAIYAALKSAQHNLSINLARQLAPFGITVNNLSPGLIATERNRWRRADMAEWAEIERRICPMGRAGTPEEMANAALLLCSDAGSYITGADLYATGGGHLPG